MNEDLRRRINVIICWVSWTGSIILALWIVADDSRRHFGAGVVVLIGIAIAASLIRSRYKLSDTISEVFHAGVLTGWNTPKREEVISQQEEPEEPRAPRSAS